MENAQRRLMWHGMFLFLLGLLSGFAESSFANVRMGLAAHLQGVMNGTFLLALSSAWIKLQLSSGVERLAFWAALYGTYVNWLVTTLSAIFGTKALSPLTGTAQGGRPWQETMMTAGFISVGIAIVVAAVLLLWGFRRGAQKRSSWAEPRRLVFRIVLGYVLHKLGSSMLIEIGHIEAIFRYPVKSMAGERLEVAELGWYGLEGDRRLAFRRIQDRSGMPWLTASKLPDLLRFAPLRRDDGAQGDLPTHIRTPEGEEMPVFGEDLAKEVGRRYGAPVEMMQLRHGIFDEASISAIACDTVREIGRLAGRSLDIRRFRPNVVVRLLRSVPFQEDEWLGRVLSFGKGDDAPAIAVTMRDVRCSMMNLDPDSASPAPEVMKAVVRVNQNNAGIYGAVTRVGRLAVGQAVLLRATTEKRERR